MAHSASTWLLEEQRAQAQRNAGSDEGDPTATTAAAPVAPPFQVLPERTTFHNSFATASGPISTPFSTTSAHETRGVSMGTYPVVHARHPLYSEVRDTNPQNNAAFSPPMLSPSGYYQPSEYSATTTASPFAFNPPSSSPAYPSSQTPRRSLSFAAAQASAGLAPPTNVRRSAAPHGSSRAPNAVPISSTVLGVFCVVSTGSLPPSVVTYPGAPGPGFFVPTDDGQFERPTTAEWLQSHSPYGPPPPGPMPSWAYSEGAGDISDPTGLFGAQAMDPMGLQVRRLRLSRPPLSSTS